MLFLVFVVVSSFRISVAHCFSISLWTSPSLFEGICSGLIMTLLTSLCLSWQDQPVWMTKDEAHSVKTMKVTTDVMLPSADILQSKEVEASIFCTHVLWGLRFSLSSMLSGQSSGQRWAQPSSHGVFNPWLG